MSVDLIRRAFEGALQAYADPRSIPVAWENVRFTQPDVLYLRANLLPAPTLSADLGRLNRRYEGIFQVSIVAPIGTGPAAAQAVANDLAGVFSPASPFTVSGLKVWCAQPLSVAPAVPDPDRFVLPCSVQYLADTY